MTTESRQFVPTQGYITAAVERDLPTGDMVLNIGPQHPSTHGVLRVVVRLDGERVVDADPVLGYMHRGYEKLVEQRSPLQINTLLNRVDWISSFIYEVPFCIACEQLAEIEVSERAQAVRVLMMELYRLASHSLFCGVYGLELGALTAPMYGYRDREYALDLHEAITGQRLHSNYSRIGGLKEDLPKGFYETLPKVVEYFRTRVDQWLDFLIGNDVFTERTRDVGPLPLDMALDYGVSGPNLRASGIAYDVRKQDSILGYDGYEFQVPVGETGDCFDRYVQRVRELWESCNIIEQVVEGLPPGPVTSKVPRTFRIPEGEIYVRAEGPRGEIGYHIISTGAREPYRMRLRTPSFANIAVLPEILRGVFVPDVVAILGSFDFVVGDVDR
ncbi:MAG TPA: NADH-quinone oxidoreductase subunit D 1 [Actinomycetota bacterium]|nr:NADH-quinone oxidoreductase subunit D 1 [Actinomycetota bacterium]